MITRVTIISLLSFLFYKIIGNGFDEYFINDTINM